MSWLDFFTDFIPDENASVEKQRNWRKRVALVACSSWLFVFVILAPALVAILFTGAPLIGRVAWANDEERKVETKISQALTPVNNELNKLNTKLSKLDALVYEQVKSSLSSRICASAAKRVKETEYNERQRLLNEVNNMRQQYREITGIDFNPDDC